MQEFLNRIIPNVMDKPEQLWRAIVDTLIMMAWSGILFFVFGLFLGILITVCKRGGILENRVLYQILDQIINFFRSIPFIILIAALLPLTRLMMGTALGIRGAIVPLVFGTVPFFARQVETSLAEIDYGLIEAAQSMGTGPIGIIFRVYLRESVASIARGTTITIISQIGIIAMAGVVGAGGLGDFAIRFGLQRSQLDVTYVTMIIIWIMVSLVQLLGNFIASQSTH